MTLDKWLNGVVTKYFTAYVMKTKKLDNFYFWTLTLGSEDMTSSDIIRISTSVVAKTLRDGVEVAETDELEKLLRRIYRETGPSATADNKGTVRAAHCSHAVGNPLDGGADWRI